ENKDLNEHDDHSENINNDQNTNHENNENQNNGECGENNKNKKNDKNKENKNQNQQNNKGNNNNNNKNKIEKKDYLGSLISLKEDWSYYTYNATPNKRQYYTSLNNKKNQQAQEDQIIDSRDNTYVNNKNNQLDQEDPYFQSRTPIRIYKDTDEWDIQAKMTENGLRGGSEPHLLKLVGGIGTSPRIWCSVCLDTPRRSCLEQRNLREQLNFNIEEETHTESGFEDGFAENFNTSIFASDDFTNNYNASEIVCENSNPNNALWSEDTLNIKDTQGSGNDNTALYKEINKFQLCKDTTQYQSTTALTTGFGISTIPNLLEPKHNNQTSQIHQEHTSEKWDRDNILLTSPGNKYDLSSGTNCDTQLFSSENESLVNHESDLVKQDIILDRNIEDDQGDDLSHLCREELVKLVRKLRNELRRVRYRSNTDLVCDSKARELLTENMLILV
ncbi:unnamed protein product, partial [Meganyctiphanes norvegica]